MVVDTAPPSPLQCSPGCRATAVRPCSTPRRQAPTPSSAHAEGNDLSTATPTRRASPPTCIYQASYGDSSFSVGYLSKDTVSFAPTACPTSTTVRAGQRGPLHRSARPHGLGRNKLSLLYQLAPTLGYSFSYCLPSSSSSGYLSIGSYNPGQYSYTPMVFSTLGDSLYFIKLSGMTVAGKPLAVSSSEYSSLPTIIDSLMHHR
ncbi:hypothetical protein ZWY2020_022078 [Hordeum vulgare]|nr:hypothetical protein ZWY2020_022078 [Hordeum vulgare]